MTRHVLAFICFATWASTGLSQQDTLRISLAEAEQRFLQKNLLILAAHFNVEVARAGEIQAGLWNNPNLAIEQNVYNPYTGKWFDMTSTGNTGLQVQQLLHLAGQRSKLVEAAGLGTRIAEESLDDALRALHATLRTTCYDLIFQRRSAEFYDESIASIGRTVRMMESVYEHRAVLLSEVLRIKALLFTLQTERLALFTKIEASQATLKVLLADTSTTVIAPGIDLAPLEAVCPDSLHYQELVQMAMAQRPDLRKASLMVKQDQANLSYQKALSVPDLTVGGLWSRNGSYIPNYVALTLSIDLPLFNRNQGSIAAAERTVDADSAAANNVRVQAAHDVASALKHAVEADRLFRAFDRTFPTQFRTLIDGAIMNHQRRNMSSMEFADFVESYRTSMMQMYQLENDRLDALEALNLAVGVDLFTR